jgi:hypothetical protein
MMQAGLELIIEPRLAWTSRSSCLCFPGAEITGVHHHTQVFQSRLLDLRLDIPRVVPKPRPAPEFFWMALIPPDPKKKEHKPDANRTHVQ